jgi:hypothetical protein
MINPTTASRQEVIPATVEAQTALTPGRFSTRGVAVRLFITCWLIFCLHFATNTVREIYPALSLAEHFSFDVSEYSGLHPDIFEMPGRGTYINSNPGASMLGAVPCLIARPVMGLVVERIERARAASPEPDAAQYNSVYPMARDFYREARARGLDVKFGLAAGVTQALCMAPLSALSTVVMFYILLSLTGARRKAIWLAVLYAVATPVLYRTAQLNQNILVGHFALFAFALLWRPWDDPANPRRPHYFLAGLLCGFTVVLDYSGIVVLAALSIYGLVRRASLPPEVRSRADIYRFAAGVMIWAAVLMGYQWAAFGNPFYPAQHYMPPATFTGYGYKGMDWPHLDLLWETGFSMRFGLFTSAPLLLLALFIPGWFNNRIRIVERREMWLIVILSMAFFIFCAANQYTRMQFNTGVRHVVPVVPFLFLLASGVLLRLPKLAAVLIGIITTYWSWCLAMYRDVELGIGIFESIRHITFEGFRLPWLVTLENMGYVSGASAIPLLLLSGVILWAIWTVGAGKADQPARPLFATSGRHTK